MGSFDEVVADGPYWSAPMESLTEYQVPNRVYTIGSSVTVEPGAGVEGTNAFRFDGSLSGSNVHYRGYWPSSSDFTGELWVKGVTVKASTLMFHSYTNSYLRVYLGTTALGVPEGYVGQIGSPMITATTNVIDGEWHHVAITHTGGTVRLYVDGVEEAMTTESILVPAATGSSFVSVASTVNRLGNVFSDPQQRFDGLVDNPAVFNKALSPERIAARMPQPELPPTQIDSGLMGTITLRDYYGASVGITDAIPETLEVNAGWNWYEDLPLRLRDFGGASIETASAPLTLNAGWYDYEDLPLMLRDYGGASVDIDSPPLTIDAGWYWYEDLPLSLRGFLGASVDITDRPLEPLILEGGWFGYESQPLSLRDFAASIEITDAVVDALVLNGGWFQYQPLTLRDYKAGIRIRDRLPGIDIEIEIEMALKAMSLSMQTTTLEVRNPRKRVKSVLKSQVRSTTGGLK